MPRWKRHLLQFESLQRELVNEVAAKKPNLRFKTAFVKASDVAQQYFCEKKLEMEYLHGRVETEEKSLGTEAHEKLLEDTAKIERKRLWQKIYGRTPVSVHEMMLLARYKDVALAGVPDCVLYANGLPAILFEYKFSRSGRLFDSYQVQAGTYGILLKNVGFVVSHLFNAIVVADPMAKDDKRLKNRVLDAILKNGAKDAILNVEGANIYFKKFDVAKAGHDLEWALDFWKSKREAIPTSNPNKCRSCEYSAECREMD